MTPNQIAESGISYLQKAVLAILEAAPEAQRTATEISERLNIPSYRIYKPNGRIDLNGTRRLIEGILVKLENDGLVLQVDREYREDRHWKLTQ